MSDPSVTHWPNRPRQPFWWFVEWGPGDDFATLSESWTRRCCITSMQLSCQADASYFDMMIYQTVEPEQITRVLVPTSSTVTIAYPTPLVIGGGELSWDLVFGPKSTRGLFQATIVGYDVITDPDQPAIREIAAKPRIPTDRESRPETP